MSLLESLNDFLLWKNLTIIEKKHPIHVINSDKFLFDNSTFFENFYCFFVLFNDTHSYMRNKRNIA